MARRRNRRRGVINPPLASMGDIAFLLIAFFVLVSQFDKPLGHKYEQPQSEDIEELENVPPITIVVDEEGTIWIANDEVPNLDSLEGLLAEKAAAINEGSRSVVLRADVDTPQRVYQGILSAIAANSLPVAMSGDELTGTNGPQKNNKQAK